MKDKKKLEFSYRLMDSSAVLEQKQKIAIERFGPVFQDEVFFKLEMEMNTDLADVIDKEYIRRSRKKVLN